MKVFVLEDDPQRILWFRERFIHDELTLVETAEDGIREFPDREWDLVSLDHDLGGEVYVDSSLPNTGAGFVRAVVADLAECPVVAVHSYNLLGATEMVRLIKDAGGDAIHAPFRGHMHLGIIAFAQETAA
jgi:hypothetical protein